jgi:ribosomal protein RSM22 (predicted rRNA methylase)
MKRSPRTGTGPLDSIAESVLALSRLLTRDRERLAPAYLRDPALRQAYRSYFLPANLPKIHLPLAELAAHHAGLLEQERVTVLDVGTGPGTSVLGALEYFASRRSRPRLEFTAVDAVQENLREARALFAERAERYPGQATLVTVQCRAEEAVARIRRRFDLLVLSNVLNELFTGDGDKLQRRAEMVGEMMRELLDEKGSCIVIEPALRETSRDLLEARDRLLAGGAHVYSPCLVQSPCPALKVPRDWCHEERPWTPPETVRAIDERTGLRKDSLKFSYLVLRKDGRSLSELGGADAVRVVSEPLVSKGKREYYVCGPAGRRLVVRLDKDAARANAPFETLRRGDVVRFEGAREEERRTLITRETVVVTEQVGTSPGQPGS